MEVSFLDLFVSIKMYLKFFFNIKFNKEIKPFKFFPNFLSSKTPKIKGNKLKNINMIKHGSVWKTTSKFRNKKLIAWVNDYIKHEKKKPIILELGASSGISVFPKLKKKNKIKKYFLTDLNLNYFYKRLFNFTLLFSDRRKLIPFMAFNNFFIFYSDNKSLNIIFSLISYLIRMVISVVSFKIKKIKIDLLDSRIFFYQSKYPLFFKEYNILETWKGLNVNLIIISNLLNYSYFSQNLMKLAVLNVFNSVKKNSIIIVGDNKKKNKISVFKKKLNKFILLHNEGGMVDSHNIFLNFKKK